MQHIARYVQPAVKRLCQTRNFLLTARADTKPVIKIAEDRFQVTLDVRKFCHEELMIKAAQEYLIIEGKRARKVPNGCMVKQFVRKFRLPEGCDPVKIESKLSDDGFLTVIAHRHVNEDKCKPYEKSVSIVRTQNLSDAMINNPTCFDYNYPSYTPDEIYIPINKDPRTHNKTQAPTTPPAETPPPEQKKSNSSEGSVQTGQ